MIRNIGYNHKVPTPTLHHPKASTRLLEAQACLSILAEDEVQPLPPPTLTPPSRESPPHPDDDDGELQMSGAWGLVSAAKLGVECQEAVLVGAAAAAAWDAYLPLVRRQRFAYVKDVFSEVMGKGRGLWEVE